MLANQNQYHFLTHFFSIFSLFFPINFTKSCEIEKLFSYSKHSIIVSKGKVRMKAKILKLSKMLTKKGKVNKEEPPLDLIEAFFNFSNGENHMSKDQLLGFMGEYQGEQNCTLLDLEPMIEKVLQMGSSSSSIETRNVEGLSIDDFVNFLLLDDFNGPLKDEVSTFYFTLLIYFFYKFFDTHKFKLDNDNF